MRKHSYVAAVAVVLVLLMAASVLANGAVSGTTPSPTQVPVTVQPAPPVGTGAGPAPATPAQPTVTTGQRCFPMSQLVTLTVSEVWELSGRNYDAMQEFVRAMIDMSADKRNLNIPDTREAGAEIGRLIRQKSESDPNQLLYAVIDSSVREYATLHGITPGS